MSCLYDELLNHRDSKNDKRIFGLVLQGGGMRGVYSSAALAPMVEYGFTDTFEHVVGSSAGAINGVYFLSGPANIYKIYSDELTNKNFVNLMRRDKKVDIDFLVDAVLKAKYPLDLSGLTKTRTRLHVVLTNARTGRKKVISDHHLFKQIYEEIRATAALPLLYDKKIKIEGNEYIDGGVADLLPIDVAIKLGCTDILVVMTQQLQSFNFDKRHVRLVNHLVRRFARKQSTAVRKILPNNEKVLKNNLRLLQHPSRKIRIYLLEPSDEDILVSIATTDKLKIKALAKLGIADMDKFLHKTL